MPGSTEQDVIGIVNEKLKQTWIGKQMSIVFDGFRQVFGGDFSGGMETLSNVSPWLFPIRAMANVATMLNQSPIFTRNQQIHHKNSDRLRGRHCL